MSRRVTRVGKKSGSAQPEIIVVPAAVSPGETAVSPSKAAEGESADVTHLAKTPLDGRTRAAQRAGSTDDGSVIPDRAPGDSPEVWGDAADGESANDQRLRDNVPPHW